MINIDLKKIIIDAKNILIIEDTLDYHTTREEQKEFGKFYDAEIKKILELGESYLYDLLISLVEDAEENADYESYEKLMYLKVLKLWLKKKSKKTTLTLDKQ